MEPGPLPPHERTWRHPSELGPTQVDVDTGSYGRVIAFATGTLAIVMVGLMIVAVTPRQSSAPTALSATTAPGFTVVPAPPRPNLGVPLGQQAIRPASFNAIPNAIASNPRASLDVRNVARFTPAPTDTVFVLTAAVTYQLPWVDVPLLSMPEGSVVVDSRGELVAHVSNGHLMLFVDD